MAYFSPSVCNESVSQVTATNSVDLGTRRVDNGNEYVYCYNDMVSAATLGVFMIASGGSGYSLVRSSAAALDMPVCVVKNVAVPAANYFWGLVKGQALLSSLAFAVGDMITVGAQGLPLTLSVGSFPTGTAYAKCLVVATASTQAYCQVKL